MNIQLLLELLPQPTFIIFISTFAGAFAGEFYKEVNDETPCSFIKFSSKFLASWLIAAATVLFFQSVFEVGKNEVLMSLSIAFGFIGHKDSIKYLMKLIESKFNNK